MGDRWYIINQFIARQKNLATTEKPLIFLLQANSISETLSLLDFGTNYCNLFNLMDGSGLAQDPGFTEDTNDFECTQYSSADCDIY